jgi:hypothetical protein
MAALQRITVLQPARQPSGGFGECEMRTPLAYKCATCGEMHAGLPMDIGFAKPADFFTIPAAERGRRCALTADWCVIDQRRFYVRGCLYVSVLDADDPFGWGLWARVSQRSFQRYLALYSADGSGEAPFRGRLSVEDRRGYEGLDGHAVRIQLRTAAERPAFTLARSKHLLYREQQQGITLHRVQEMLKTLFPDEFA